METRFLGKRQRGGPSEVRRRAGRAATGALLVAGFCSSALLAIGGTSAGAATRTASAPVVPGYIGPEALHPVGSVNLSYLSGASAPHAAHAAEGANYPHHVVPLGLVHHRTTAARAAAPLSLQAGRLAAFSGNNGGATSFDGINATVNSSVNAPTYGGVGDVTPPDQGLGAGPSPEGTAIVEMVNDTLEAYSPSGKVLLPAIAAYQVFDEPPLTFMSDPRVYYDPLSGHWFLTMFAFPALPGSGTGPTGCNNGGSVQNGCQAAQYVAVSAGTNPLGSYEVFWLDTTDGTNSTSEVPGPGGHIGDDCPCFGDYDMVGLDSSGFYISTNEFCANSSTSCLPIGQGGTNQNGGFNGTVIYAISKSELIAAAAGKGKAPAVQRYGVDSLSDPFAAYHLSPSVVTQGSSAPDTEYFVESNANLPGDQYLVTKNLEVFALLGTSALADPSGKKPAMVMTTVGSEPYTAVPPNAAQKSGPIPYGNLAGTGTTPSLQTDFNAVQEVTYASGLLYAELDTGFGLGNQENAGAAWFVLKPSTSSTSLSAANEGNGYVETTQNVLYPDIAVDAAGHGFMAFSVAGAAMYPSAAYVTFDGTHGAGDVVHVVGAGANPEDDFSCYPAQGVSGACRWGDYSMAQAYAGNIYMSTEYIPSDVRDSYANWGTRLYWASSQGYWVASSDGNVAASGDAPAIAGTSVSGVKSITGIAATRAGEGYWLVGHDGSVTARGDASWLGDLPSLGVSVSNIVAIAPTADGNGYWLVGSDGGVFAFGDARYVGSIPGLREHVSDIVGMVATSNGEGYWMVGADGGVFAFGNTHFVGSLPALGVHVSDIRAIVPSTTDNGYVLVGSDGGTFVFGNGDAFVGSLPGEGIHVSDIVGLALTPSGRGYWLAGSNGGIYPLGDAQHFPVPRSVNLPVAAIAGT